MGGGGGEVPAAYNSKTINDNETDEIWWSSKESLAKISPVKEEKFRRC